ncbi:MAG: imidazolonepropionase [Candidatus Thorarchaeota archaeon]|nr:imidazolonepropionase [Candidatus Thorarchaeota archaeon]
MRTDLLLTHIGQLATLEGGSKRPRVGDSMRELGIVRDAAVAVSGGRFQAVGTTEEVVASLDEDPVLPEMDCHGMFAMPGFVDSHTHLVFAGSRENDFAMKLAGKTYLEILKAGGGILNSVTETRKATAEQLMRIAFSFGEEMVREGTTTIEVKSGYGLNTETEVKMLDVAAALGKMLPARIVATFLGAHAVPPEYEGRTDDYVDIVVSEMIPQVASRGLAQFCDVFCEKGVFDVEQSRRILLAAKKAGMKLKVHADEIVQLGGAGLAAELGATSADHLLRASEDDLEAMRKAGTIATLLPATAFSLNTEYANARKMIDMGLPVALATDFNPNCANSSMFFTLALACYKMRMFPREAITAATVNAAHALALQQEVGSVEVGKRADLIVLECPSPEYLSYRFGMNLVHTMIANGEVVHSRIGT